jgi:hypothetical protein
LGGVADDGWAVVVESVHEVGEVGRGELPFERPRGLVAAFLEVGEALDDNVEVLDIVGREHIPLFEACTGVCTITAFGNCAVSRLIAAFPRWEEPLSTIQNTRSALL